jgi:hypothetical protein
MPGVQRTGKGASLSSIPEFDDKQLAAARAKAWHQDGNPLLTAESALAWLGNFGLVLFVPRSLQLPSPAPSLVEATLGASNAAPTTADSQTARGFVGRLVAEGTALPLNLMGVAGDTPDFVVSAQMFPYIFTLRGDKAWKQPPSTSGPVKVSPLGLKAFEVLTEHRSLTAVQLASEMGREVTEAATLRVLTELWSQLRVIPLPQTGDEPVLWELTTRRFTKAIKSGANAGQPKALSALISLYLAQVTAATEEEITTFLSPLTARSRLREVLHALTGARQLETTAVEGKTLLHLPGALVDYSAATAAESPVESAPVAVVQAPKKVGTGRIRSFAGDRAAAGEFRGKPARTFATGAKPARGGDKVPARFAPRADGKSDRERRPFKKPDGPGASTKPSFAKPWDEDRKKRPAAPTRTDSFTKFRRSAPEDREPLGPREQAGLPLEKRTYPKASFDRGSKPGGFAKRPFTPRTSEPGGFAAKRASPKTAGPSSHAAMSRVRAEVRSPVVSLPSVRIRLAQAGTKTVRLSSRVALIAARSPVDSQPRVLISLAQRRVENVRFPSVPTNPGPQMLTSGNIPRLPGFQRQRVQTVVLRRGPTSNALLQVRWIAQERPLVRAMVPGQQESSEPSPEGNLEQSLATRNPDFQGLERKNSAQSPAASRHFVTVLVATEAVQPQVRGQRLARSPRQRNRYEPTGDAARAARDRNRWAGGRR